MDKILSPSFASKEPQSMKEKHAPLVNSQQTLPQPSDQGEQVLPDHIAEFILL